MLIEWNAIERLCPDIRGIIHVGAYNGAEAKEYGSTPTKWIEACPDLYRALVVKPKYHFAATDFKGTVRFNRMKFAPANSLLEPNLNAKRRADVRVKDTILVPADRIDSIQEDENMLVMDIQCGEMAALRGTDISKIDYIYTEVHRAETYFDCPHYDEIKSYLKDFEVVLESFTKHQWGDSLFIRKTLL